jgi:hypothetical protein
MTDFHIRSKIDSVVILTSATAHQTHPQVCLNLPAIKLRVRRATHQRRVPLTTEAYRQLQPSSMFATVELIISKDGYHHSIHQFRILNLARPPPIHLHHSHDVKMINDCTHANERLTTLKATRALIIIINLNQLLHSRLYKDIGGKK